MALDPSLQEQQLVEAALKRRFTPLHARERRAEALLGGGFALACALVALAAPPWDAAIDPAAALFSALTLAVAARVHFIVGPGYTVPTQLAFIPLAFAIAPALLAPAVASFFAAVQLADVLRGRLPSGRRRQPGGDRGYGAAARGHGRRAGGDRRDDVRHSRRPPRGPRRAHAPRRGLAIRR